jgi:hypothetical protein
MKHTTAKKKIHRFCYQCHSNKLHNTIATKYICSLWHINILSGEEEPTSESFAMSWVALTYITLPSDAKQQLGLQYRICKQSSQREQT